MSRSDPEPPDRPSGTRAVVDALHVRRNAIRGFAGALAVVLVVFAFFVVIPGTTRPPVLYVTLAFVLAMSLGALLSTVLVAIRAYRLATGSSE